MLIFLLLLIIGVVVVSIIYEKIDQLKYQNETATAVEQSLLMQRDFDLLEQRLAMFINMHTNAERAHNEEADERLYRLFLFGDLDSSVVRSDHYYRISFPQVERTAGTPVYVDLHELNNYFRNANRYARAYAAVYTAEGYCLVHPDSSNVGMLRDDGRSWLEKARDAVQHSAYLNLPVRRFVYPLQHFFSDAYIVISVPKIGQEEITDILFLSLLLGGVLLVTVIAFSVSLYMQRKKEHVLALERVNIQKEQALARFERLREQMNPHFLFNALGSLQQLVKQDQDRAQLFVGKMAKMYRTMLRQDHAVYASLEEELSFASAYLFLQEIRFKNAFAPIDIQVDKVYLQRLLPRWSLQIVVENAIKHNEFTALAPLSIQIAVDGERLVVRNNYRPRRNTDLESGGYGLQYINSVYQAAGTEGFHFGTDAEYFAVYLPLL